MKRIIPIAIIALMLMNSCIGKVGTNTDAASENINDELYFPIDSLPVDSDMIHECISEDGNMKFISWNTGMGGTCPDYGLYCVFKTDDGNIHKVNLKEQDPDVAWVNNVHSIKKADGTTFYIAKRSHRASSSEGYMWMDGFMIDGDSQKVVSAFDGGDDLDDCGMSICYSVPDWYYMTNGEGYDWIFEYDAASKNLYVPETSGETMTQRITDRYRVYHFDGITFASKGSHPHKGLHKSLHEYKHLECFFRTKNHIVRIDRLGNGKLRYASWKATSSMSDKPEVIIAIGEYNEENDVYAFENKGVTYLCKVSEDIPTDNEGVSDHHEYLIAKKGSKTILKEEVVAP